MGCPASGRQPGFERSTRCVRIWPQRAGARRGIHLGAAMASLRRCRPPRTAALSPVASPIPRALLPMPSWSSWLAWPGDGRATPTRDSTACTCPGHRRRRRYARLDAHGRCDMSSHWRLLLVVLPAPVTRMQRARLRSDSSWSGNTTRHVPLPCPGPGRSSQRVDSLAHRMPLTQLVISGQGTWWTQTLPSPPVGAVLAADDRGRNWSGCVSIQHVDADMVLRHDRHTLLRSPPRAAE